MMHFLKVTGLMGLALSTANASSNPACSSQSVVFVTVTAPEVTKTVVSLLYGKGATAVEIALAASQTSVSADITTTLTSYVTLTEFSTVAPAIPTPSGSGQVPTLTVSHPEPTGVAADKGRYYFSEHDGTLAWLDGKTPPATGSFLTITTVITMQPVPSNFPALVEETTVSSAEESVVATSYSTVSLYSVSTVYSTKVITSTIRIPAIPPKAFVNPGSVGWNTSSTPLLKGGKHQVLSDNPKPTVWQTGATHVTGQLQARQVGAVVVATIDGAVVSWINSYDGKPTSTLPSPYPTAEVATGQSTIASNEKSENQPVYPLDLTPPVTQTKNSAANCIKPSASSLTPANQSPFSIVITKSVASVLSLTSVQSTPIQQSGLSAVKEPASLAIYSWKISPSSRRKSAFAPSKISSTQSLKTTTRSRFPIRSESTLSTVTTKSVTSVFSLTPIQPTSNNGPDPSNASNNPAFCNGKIGGKAEFVLTFDDLPTFSTGPDNTDIPPIFNPYRKLYFEEHFGYVPPPSVAFLPHSPPQLAVYRVGDGLNVNGSPGAGLELVGEFGSGPRALYSAFWIDAFSFWIGCENDGPSDCKVTINGYELASVIRTAYQDVTIPPCRESRGCQLTYVELGEDFRNLTGVQILAAVDRQLTDFYLDDISLAWSNNTCAAQRQRATVR